ncbi:MAG: DNA (cytosine-5-)-methyltransferase [Bacteroidetes bacterium]|nr:DNA (cytosine-5-)-methyltransferase [Bacteroidota bacterium]
MKNNNKVRFIDLFAGLGGIRIGFEQAALETGFKAECVFTSEIKTSAIAALQNNFEHHDLAGDITKIHANQIPDFDVLLAGFPCQAFSVAGKQKGFVDTRGTLFFDIERILEEKKPHGFILENVEGLVLHDRLNKSDKIGQTLETILNSLKKKYKVNYRVLDSKEFGVPQSRRRIFIVGTRKKIINLENFDKHINTVGTILENDVEFSNTKFSKLLLKYYKPEELEGKFIKDKRGGSKNIHSWDIEAKGKVSNVQKELLNRLFKERRKKHWATKIGIDWMDGMPLTHDQIGSFFNHKDLHKFLDDLVEKGYLTLEHPKKKILTNDAPPVFDRVPDTTKPKGYNITSGKLSFEYSHFLNPNAIAPTLVAMDMDTIGVVGEKGIRKLTIREGLRLFGFPDTYNLDFLCDSELNKRKAYDLLGNSVCVPVVKAVSKRLLENLEL